MRRPYLLPGLLALMLIVAAVALVGASRAPSEVTDVTQAARPVSAGTMGTGALGRSPFLVAHDQGRLFVPDGENLAASFHVEMEAIRQRLDTAPNDTESLLKMARLKQDGHQPEEAVAYYQRYLAEHPEGRDAWLDLARTLGELGRWDEALDATEFLLTRFPDDPAGLYNQGAIYANMGRIQEAADRWEQVARQDRDAEMRTLATTALGRLGTTHP